MYAEARIDRMINRKFGYNYSKDKFGKQLFLYIFKVCISIRILPRMNKNGQYVT